MTSFGANTYAIYSLHGCSEVCKNNKCHLFQWNKERKEIIKEKKLSEDGDSVISVPECSNESETWLKRPFELPTTTTTIMATTTTTSKTPSKGSVKTQAHDDEITIFKYFYFF